MEHCSIEEGQQVGRQGLHPIVRFRTLADSFVFALAGSIDFAVIADHQ